MKKKRAVVADRVAALQPLVAAGHIIGAATGDRDEGLTFCVTRADVMVAGILLGEKVHVRSMPKGQRLRTIDLRRPDFPNVGDWRVAGGRLVAATLPPQGGRVLLRSWQLPDGEPQDLGIVEWTDSDRLPLSGITPNGLAWVYLKGRDVYACPLPIGSGPDQLLARLATDVAWSEAGPGTLLIGDKAGEARAWLARGNGRPREPRDPRTRRRDRAHEYRPVWPLVIRTREGTILLSDATAWPGSRPRELRRSGSWFLSGADVHPSGRWIASVTSGARRVTF